MAVDVFVANATVGWVIVNVLDDPITLAVDGVPKPVNADPEDPIVTPVTTASPVPVVEVDPVATVIAVPSVTLEAVVDVPNDVLVAVTSDPLPPPITRVSVFPVPVPIVNVHVDLLAVTEELLETTGTVTSVFPVTLGTVVVTKFFPVSALTDLTNVSEVGEAYPVTTVFWSLLFQAVDAPEAVAPK